MQLRTEVLHGVVPEISIPDLPATGNVCLLRVNKQFDGGGSGTEEDPYPCRSGRTTRGKTEFGWRLFSHGGPTCDESERVFPNARLGARARFIRREDDFACLSGTFRILKPGQGGQPDDVLFAGRLELIFRSGSHQSLNIGGNITPGERCDEPKHVEGWLVGLGQGDLSSYRLSALICGEATLPGVFAPIPPVNRMTGVLLQLP